MQVRVQQAADWNDDKAEARWARRAWEGPGDDEPDDDEDDDDDDEQFPSLADWRTFLRDCRARHAARSAERRFAGSR